LEDISPEVREEALHTLDSGLHKTGDIPDDFLSQNGLDEEAEGLMVERIGYWRWLIELLKEIVLVIPRELGGRLWNIKHVIHPRDLFYDPVYAAALGTTGFIFSGVMFTFGILDGSSIQVILVWGVAMVFMFLVGTHGAYRMEVDR